MSAPAKWEYLKVMHGRYRAAPRKDKGQLLDEFCRRPATIASTPCGSSMARRLAGRAPAAGDGRRPMAPP